MKGDKSYLPDPQTFPYHQYTVAVQKQSPEHAPPDWPSEIVRTVYQKQEEEFDGRRYFVWKEVNG